MMIIIKIRELVLKRIIQFYSPLASARTLITGQLCAAVWLGHKGFYSNLFNIIKRKLVTVFDKTHRG